MILYYLILAVSAFITFFILKSKKVLFHNIAENSVALVNELIDKSVDDNQLIRNIQKRTNILLLDLIKAVVLLILSFAAGSLPVILYVYFIDSTESNIDFTSLYAIISISVGATIPFLIRNKKEKHNYSDLSKLLHRMILNNFNVSRKLFDIESKKISRKAFKTRDDFVIVTGLARAGTTSLMTDLSKTGEFVSLSYANMPFLTSPVFWKKIYNPKKEKLKERSHKDGILMGYNSTEALEEYFFKMLANNEFIKDDYLEEYSLTEKDYENYLNYQRNIRSDNNKLYLAKNNNFILRYNSIRRFNEKFVLVVLYRDPLSHATSLMEKHLDYIKLQNEDAFVLEYMNWLGHHEFGLNQKQFLFNSCHNVIEGKKNTIDYWLEIWINYYSNIIEINHPNTVFINYADYCENPERIIKTVFEKVNVSVSVPKKPSFVNKRTSLQNYSEDLYRKAMEIFNKLKNTEILNNKSSERT